MRIPRNLDAIQLITLLRSLGYEVTRQTGSHIRLTTNHPGQHHLTIPNHDPLKVGTLNAILTEVAGHLGIPKRELFKNLFN